MKTIVVDASLRDQLLAAGEVAELKDASGRVLGRFVAVPPAVYVVEGELPSEEELDRRTRESRRFTTDQVIERLRTLRRGP
jgi:hypothetical protein